MTRFSPLLTSSPTIIPAVESHKWFFLCSKGLIGPAGVPGPAGPKGEMVGVLVIKTDYHMCEPSEIRNLSYMYYA